MSACVEAIARALLEHKGYTEDEINAPHAHKQECWEDFTIAVGGGRIPVCRDEDDKSYHPGWDALIEACDIANVAIDALESIGLDVAGFERSLDEPA